MKSLDAYTYEELGQAMAHVLACAGEELLNDAEVERFWEVHDEIQRRSARSDTVVNAGNSNVVEPRATTASPTPGKS